MKTRSVFNDLESLHSQTLKSQRQGEIIKVHRTSQSPSKIKNIVENKKQNISTQGLHNYQNQKIIETLHPKDFNASQIPFLLPFQRQSTQRKPIFPTQKIQSSNIKFILPQLHEYTPQAKSKIQLRSIISVRQSLDMSFNNEQFVNSNNLQHKDDTILNLPQILQSTIQSNSRTVTEIAENKIEEKVSKPLSILALIGIVLAYCFYVTLK